MSTNRETALWFLPPGEVCALLCEVGGAYSPSCLLPPPSASMASSSSRRRWPRCTRTPGRSTSASWH